MAPAMPFFIAVSIAQSATLRQFAVFAAGRNGMVACYRASICMEKAVDAGKL
jgi:hypothetical protein